MGRTVRRPPDAVTAEYVQIPQAIQDYFQLVTLAVDILFVNSITFLVSMACGLDLVTAKQIPSRTAKNLASGIKRVTALYSRGGFPVGTIMMDNKFEQLRDLAPKIVVNTTAAKKMCQKSNVVFG
jgi:hypothetical protein